MGRPREFDLDQAVEKAMILFWQNGYDGTSLSDLTQTIGCKPPSFYFAFGSKDGLFAMVLERYYEVYLGAAEGALAEPTARGVAEGMLTRLADMYTDSSHPRGCLAVKCSLSGSQNVEAVHKKQTELRAGRRRRLQNRFAAAVAAGDLPRDADPEQLARYILVLAWGMAMDALSGANRRQLHGTIACAMKGWPSSSAGNPV